jgi:DNA-binding CsgD family transcriptional regulator/tetratricopeptide (TPR) repeat protein
MVRQTLAQEAAPIAEIVPEIADRIDDHSAMAPNSDPLQTRFRLFQAISIFWKRAASQRPLLLILDNLHWADASSLRLLEFFAPDLASIPMLVLFTYRDIELSRQHPLSITLGELSRCREFRRLRLTGLSRGETAQMMKLAVGSTIPSALLEKVHSQTEGNPLFVTEVTRMLLQEKLLCQQPDGNMELVSGGGLQRIPEGIKEVFGRRLNRLSDVTNQVLTWASVIGRAFDARLLAHIVDELGEDDLATAMDEAIQARIIEPLLEPARYQFGHALLRETLYDEISPLRRSRLHLKVGRALEAMCGSDTKRNLPSLAYHFWAALPGGNVEQAVAYSLRAAEQSANLLAHEESARYYGLALQGMEAGDRFDAASRCNALNSLGEAHVRGAEYLPAREIFEQAARLAIELHNPYELARAAFGFETASWCPGLSGVAAARLLREAIDLLGPGEQKLMAQLLSALARALTFSGEEAQALRVHEQAVAMARTAGDPATLAEALLATLSARWQGEHFAHRTTNCDEALELAMQSGQKLLINTASGWRMFDDFELGDIDSWRKRSRILECEADELRDPFNQYIASSSRTMHALFEGRFAEAEALAQRTLAMGDRMPGLDASGVYGVQMFTLRREQGRLGEVAALVQHFVQTTGGSKTWRPGLALIYAELDLLDNALVEFNALAVDDFGSLAHDGIWVASITYLAIVCNRLGDFDRAKVLYQLLLPHEGRNLLVGTSIACFGSADLFLGMLCTTMCQWSDAERHFQVALSFNQRQNSRPAVVHTCYQRALMLTVRDEAGDSAKVQEMLDFAQREAIAIGMQSMSNRLENFRNRLATNSGPLCFPAGLSKREVQVLRLVAMGRKNRDIASDLFVSSNTVANHIQSILRKTNSTNRTEAAAFATKNGLLNVGEATTASSL